MQWLDGLPSEQQHNIVELARKSRVQVKASKSAEDDRRKFRQEKMIRDKNRRDTLQKRAAEEKARLSKVHLVMSMHELKGVLSEIDEESTGWLKKLLELLLYKNVFRFNDNFYIQKQGTAMGTKMAPAYANIFMGALESRTLSETNPSPIDWKRGCLPWQISPLCISIGLRM